MAAATFFEHQQLARRNTRVMVLLFLLAVVAVVIAVDLVLAGVWIWGVSEIQPVEPGRAPGLLAMIRSVPPALYLWGAVGTAALILIVSTVNVAKLADGGEAVAKMVGARRISPETRDPLERRFLNIVEEMAIASGVRVPSAYIMDDEPGINAFAAGWDVSGAVVAVTRGTLQTLTRDELQGVIGHEFSHILNGDMRLNIRMIGVLAGIVFIGAIGSFIMRSIGQSRDRKDSASGGIFAVGLALFIIGYVGLFFARLIKASVSRQREFLADASSVQFTRNPDGIAGALDRIRASTALISSRHAEDMSHMFFGQSIKVWFGGLFDTHPALDERIQRVHPGFQPSKYRTKREAEAPQPAVGADTAFGRAAGFSGSAGGAGQGEGRRVADVGAAWGRSAGESATLVGTVDGAKVDYATRLLASLPAQLREDLRNADGACAALVALLLAPKDDVMQQQLDALRAAGSQALAERAKATAPLVRRLGPAYHLPVVDLALPALKAGPSEAKQELIKALEAVIQADRRVSLHEFVVLTLVREQLAPKGKPGASGSMKIGQLRSEVAAVLHLVAHAGIRPDAAGPRDEELKAALRAGATEMGLGETDVAVPAGFTSESAGAALEALKALAPLQKAVLVKGLFAVVTADGAIRVAEAELMRMVGAVLDCPLPPLLESVDPATLAV
ncbi:MAG TPA: M48 family metallopeptidase [Burkholderiales bacterium]|nr:M48 family metallopeptidase [Burkholderiales bacterium]